MLLKINLREMGCEGVNWIHLVQERPVAGSCEHGNETSVFIKGEKFLGCLSLLLASQGGQLFLEPIICD
jgi:hypothetical protein